MFHLPQDNSTYSDTNVRVLHMYRFHNPLYQHDSRRARYLAKMFDKVRVQTLRRYCSPFISSECFSLRYIHWPSPYQQSSLHPIGPITTLPLHLNNLRPHQSNLRSQLKRKDWSRLSTSYCLCKRTGRSIITMALLLEFADSEILMYKSTHSTRRKAS
jgi:hypothetical protein